MLLDGTGAQAWIDWVRRKAEAAQQDTQPLAPPTMPASAPDPAPLDPVAARQAARNAMFRQQR
jgi:hypothetical protein